MKCKQCEVPLTGKQRAFCSDKCRMAMSRGTKANEVGSGSPKANKPEQNTIRTEAKPEQNESEQPTRTSPQSTNADTPAVERGQRTRTLCGYPPGTAQPGYLADKSAECNAPTQTRPPIPGDPDYVGVCKQMDGVWQVKSDPVDMHALTDADLIRRLHCIRDWKHSPEHQEVLRRRNEVAA